MEKSEEKSPARILAIDPTTKGFGYVLFELPFHLAAWGRAYVDIAGPAGTVSRLESLLEEHKPELVVFEDMKAAGSLRRRRVRGLMADLVKCVRTHSIPVRTVSRLAVHRRFAPEGEKITKRAIAEMLVKYFPELAAELPRPRKVWESESDHMAVFDALSFAVTYAD
jgi:hypothetical protein